MSIYSILDFLSRVFLTLFRLDSVLFSREHNDLIWSCVCKPLLDCWRNSHHTTATPKLAGCSTARIVSGKLRIRYHLFIIIIILLNRSAVQGRERVIYTQSVQKTQPHNTTYRQKEVKRKNS